jgi:hypothetical protein
MSGIREPAWKDKQRIGAIVTRLEQHARGEIEMTATQIRAAEIYLRKCVPDLSAVQADVTHKTSAIDQIVAIEQEQQQSVTH